MATPVSRRTWKCSGCGRTLGEVIDGIVVIRPSAEREIRVPASGWIEQRCPRCKLTCRLHAA